MMDTVRLIIDCNASLRSHFDKHATFRQGFLQAWFDEADYADCKYDYHPTISYMERPIAGGFTHELVIEVSLPKLLFGNNIEEVREKDLHLITQMLHETLQALGFTSFSEEDILCARIARFDVCKNLVLDGRVNAGNVIRNLRMANLGGWYREYERRFDSGGIMVGWRLKCGEDITVYDKTAEINCKNKQKQKSISSKSILRCEIKLSGARIIKGRLKEAGITAPKILTFEDVFQDAVSRSIMICSFDKLYGKLPKGNLDMGIWQYAQSIASEEQGKRGGFTRWLKRVASMALFQQAPDGASLDKLVQDSFGQHNKYALHKVRDGPANGCSNAQIRELIAVKRCIEDFAPLTAADLVDIL